MAQIGSKGKWTKVLRHKGWFEVGTQARGFPDPRPRSKIDIQLEGASAGIPILTGGTVKTK